MPRPGECVATHFCAYPGCIREVQFARPWGRFCSARCRVASWDRQHPRQGVIPGFAPPPAAAKLRRLKRSAKRCLERLRQGPATNVELLAVGGMRFGARVHELRRAGHRIRTDEDKARGIVTYTLSETT